MLCISVVLHVISFASYSGEYTITLTFEENFKWCTEVITDDSSLNNEITMLYFYKTDGSGTYSQPSSYSYTFGQALGLSKISLSPLPDYNSYTYQYYTPEDTFGMSVGNYDNLDSNNQYDFFCITSNEGLKDSETRTIINTEWVELNGCYEGNY